MENTLEGKKCMSSIALFGELVEKKIDVYATLAEFIKNIIYTKSLHGFSLFDIKSFLSSEFGFNIPEIVIKNAIRKINNLKLEEKNYIVGKPINMKNDFSDRKQQIEEHHKTILSKLNEYIAVKLKRNVTTAEKNEIYDTLFYLLIVKNSVSNQFSKYINLFILENKNNTDIINSLNIIKEGVLIYSAFQYTPEEYSKNTWDEEMVLFFDTELLFSLYGLNGNLYKILLEELIELINKINKKSMTKTKKQIIELRYFSEIEDEINGYFKSAESIVQSDKKLKFQRSTAMLNILNGCGNAIEVMEKKALFFSKISYHGFELDKKDYYEEGDNAFNILSPEAYEQIRAEYSRYEQKEIDDNIKILNKVAVLRHGKNNRRRYAKYFFVTATNACLNIAKHSEVLRIGTVPLATTVEYLTERFWIKTNRNFAEIKLKNADIVIQAQMVVNSQLGISINEKVSEIESRYTKDDISFEQANAILAEVKHYRDFSGDVNTIDTDKLIYFTETSVDNFIDNYNFEKADARHAKEENVKLKNENEAMNKRLEYFEQKEANRQKIKNVIRKIIKIFFLALFVLPFLAVIVFAYWLKIKYPVIGVVLQIIGTIGALLGIFNFINNFTNVYQKIKARLK